MPDYAQLLNAGIAGVADACRVCRAVQANMQAVSRIVKDDKSPVTVADYASQAVVARTLRERLPGELFLVGEESSAFLRDPANAAHLDATLAAAREVWLDADETSLLGAIDAGGSDAQHPSFWTLDPIDGTKGFLRGQQYAVSLAYIERGRPVIGILGCPNLARDFAAPLDRPDRRGSIYFCIRGEGVFELPGDDARAHPVKIMRLEHNEGDPISLCMSFEDAHSNVSSTDRVMQDLAARGLKQRPPARLDSQAKYALVARGQADIYLRMPTRKGYVELIWDHAAGSLIAAEGGCSVTDIEGRDLDFSCGKRLEKNRGIVAAPPALHGALLGAISRTLSAS